MISLGKAFWISIFLPHTRCFCFLSATAKNKKIYTPQEAECKETHAFAITIMRVESEGCEIAVENCNLGRDVRNSSHSQPFPNNGTKIYGVHTHSSFSHSLSLSLSFNAAFFIHAKSGKFMCVPWSPFLFFYSSSLFWFSFFLTKKSFFFFSRIFLAGVLSAVCV